ncbi:MAG: class D beta-lactamase [Nibricoccus sp.]
MNLLKRFRWLFALCLAAGLSNSAFAAGSKLTSEPRLNAAFSERGLHGVFVAFEPVSGKWLTNDLARADEAFLPASTFKIPNSLIALECGAVANPDVVLKWDGKDRGFAAWNHDQAMREAFRNSTVWFYQELARRVGEERMKHWVSQFQYGNENIAGGIDVFWLQGELRISAVQQIEFLVRLRNDELPVRKENMAMVKEVMIAGRGEGWTLRAKTGMTLRVERPIAWYVGWVETTHGPVYFATNFDIKEFKDAQPRLAIAYENLVQVGALPPGVKPAH